MQNNIIRIAFGAGLLALVACASAQEPAKPTGLSIRAGVFIPTDTNTRRGGSGWFSAGVEYKMWERQGMMAGQSDQITISLDYAAKNNFRIVPLLANYVHHTGPVFITGGLGVSFSRRPIGGGMVEDRTRFGYQVGVGYEFATSQFPLFLEAKFMGNDRAELNGFGIYAGARF
jgi:hypothetical protein